MDEFIAIFEQILEQIAQRAGTFTPEEEAILSEYIKEAMSFIQDSKKGNAGTPPPPPEVEGINPGQFPSSNVNGYAYNPKTGKMLVQFHGKYPTAEGPTYEYDGVDQNTFNIINKGQVAPRTSGKNGFHAWQRNIAPSHGASVYALLREGGKNYRRVA